MDQSDANSATEDSLRDDLAAAYDGSDESVTEVKSEESQDQKETHTRDEVGRFAKKDSEPEAKNIPVEIAAVSDSNQEVKEVANTNTRKPPQSWRQDLKEKFLTLDPEIQDEAIRRENDYNKGIQRYAEDAKYAGTVKPVFDKWQPYLTQLGTNPAEAFDKLIQAEYALRTGSPMQKQAAFNKLAADYGITLGEAQEQQNIDPNVQHALTRVQQLEEQLRNQQYHQQQETQRKQQAEQVELTRLIEEFSSSPNRPHFDAVRDDMSRILQAGYAESLEDAYDKAVWARPDIRSTLLKDEEAKRIQEQAKVAESAKAKARSITGSPSGASIPIPNATIRGDLESAWNITSGRI